jgi:hypothetical protein
MATAASPLASQSSRESTGVNCSLCKEIAQAGKLTLRCFHCGDAVHVSCLHKAYKDTPGKEASKNQRDWLADFINFCALAYRCKDCVKKCATAPSKKMTVSMTPTNNDIDSMKQSLAALGDKIESLCSEMTKLKPNGSEACTPVIQPCQPKKFAELFSSDDMKNVVMQVIREERKVNTSSACLVISGFPEEGQDYSQLVDMLQFLGVKCDIMRHSRIGNQNSTKVRPIKIELRSASDAGEILNRAKQLRYDDYYANTYINRWLSESEMKLRHSQCDALNQSVPARKDGMKQYVVASGEIRQRNARGRLQPYRGVLPAVASTSTSKAKNVLGGSHVAPQQ